MNAPVARLRDAVTRNVVLLGVVSMLTDVSSEMVSAIFPVYLAFALALSPLLIGTVDGLSQGAAGVVRLAAGLLSDKWSRHKQVAAFGYGLSAVTKLGLLLVGRSVPGLSGMVLADRIGKGIRTAPRDALISLSSTPATMGTAFGVHRAMDTAGAVLGPLLAFFLLSLAPLEYDPIFVVSFCFAVVGFAVLWLFVEDKSQSVILPPPQRTPATASDTSTPEGPAGTLTPQVGSPTLGQAAGLLRDPTFRRLTVAAGVLGLATISDTFVYLSLQRSFDLNPLYVPLLFTGTSVFYMLLAAPMGRLADRVGRLRVYLGGYVALLGVYAGLLWPGGGLPVLLAYLALLGAYYAATDGVLMAISGALTPGRLRASGMAILTTATSGAKLLASLLFGILWQVFGLPTATVVFGAGLVLGLLSCAALLRIRTPAAPEEDLVNHVSTP